LIYDLADQGGEMLSLRYDLTVPFARYLAMHNVTNIKRYHIGKVYRRDQPQMNRGRFREFFQCDFDIAGSYAPMVTDAEVMKVLVEILTELQLGAAFEVKLSHRKLLDAMLDIAGVPRHLVRTICSSIDKLDKEPWEVIRREIVEEKGLAGTVADALGEMVVLRGEPIAMLDLLSTSPLSQHEDAKAALEELRVLFRFLESMRALGPIVLDLSLARGLDYYTGIIYEATVLGDVGVVGSIAAGGRYDTLVGMLGGKHVPAVGVSIGIERVLTIMEARFHTRATETQVLIASIGRGLQSKRMEVASLLWSGGIKAEFGFKPDPKMGEQLSYVFDNAIPFMVVFGEDEIAKGVVKVKDIALKTEVEVGMDQLLEDLRARVYDRA
jgi:histidyl-tRNA synthetase